MTCPKCKSASIIVQHLISLRPWLRKATWEDICNKIRDHSPDIYSALYERGKTHTDSSSAAAPGERSNDVR